MSGSNLARHVEHLPAVVQNNPVAAMLAEFTPQKYNLVTPVCAIDQLPPMTRISVQVVVVDPEDDIYAISSGKFALTKNALNRIAAAANVSWIPERSGQVDNWNDPRRVKYRAVGTIQDFNGRERVISGEKEIDLRGDADDPDSWGKELASIIQSAERQSRDPMGQIRQERLHIISFAETKAKLRALREALAIKQGTTKEKICRPWVVPTLVADYDTSDPEIKRILVAQRLGAQSALYGGGGAAQPVAPQLAQGEIIDVEPADEPVDVTNGFAEAAEPTEALDPFADVSGADEHPLPIPDDVISSCPTSDAARYEKLNWIDVMAKRAIEVFPDRAEAVFRKHASGIDWLAVSIGDIEAVYHSIVNDLKGGAS
ncbi:MAG: hypothetical protein DRJ65_00250 [Acidobacteria bacterium]|nr:MAG: hypothetical protein DRJ65_00250 [Acidobacteriota bacterium]